MSRAGLVRSFRGSVGVFDVDEGNIGALLVGPRESDGSFRGAGIGVDEILRGVVQLVATKRVKS